MCALSCEAFRGRELFALAGGSDIDDVMLVRSIMYGMMPGIPGRPARMQHSPFLDIRPASGERLWTPGAAVLFYFDQLFVTRHAPGRSEQYVTRFEGLVNKSA
jgi:hypothetical protein